MEKNTNQVYRKYLLLYAYYDITCRLRWTSLIFYFEEMLMYLYLNQGKENHFIDSTRRSPEDFFFFSETCNSNRIRNKDSVDERLHSNETNSYVRPPAHTLSHTA